MDIYSFKQLDKEGRKAFLEKRLNAGLSIAEIARMLGVSRQRMHQYSVQYNIKSPEHKRRRDSDNWTAGQRWLWRTLGSKGLNKVEKIALVESLELPETCPILGIPLNYEGGNKSDRENSPSIDQIKPGEGYTPDNTHIISWRANRIKNDSTPEELLAIYNYMKRIL